MVSARLSELKNSDGPAQNAEGEYAFTGAFVLPVGGKKSNSFTF